MSPSVNNKAKTEKHLVKSYCMILHIVTDLVLDNKLKLNKFSSSSPGREQFRSEIPGGQARLLGNPESRNTLLSESPGDARGMVNRKIERRIV